LCSPPGLEPGSLGGGPRILGRGAVRGPRPSSPAPCPFAAKREGATIATVAILAMIIILATMVVM
jgi:hypothetical protein